MTNKEAIKYAESKKMLLESRIYQGDVAAYGNYIMYSAELEFINTVISTLSSIEKCDQNSIGADWHAYGLPPSHIDRDVWAAKWKDRYRSGRIVGSGCVCSSCDMWNKRRSDFCPSCGKAMTSEAWIMLEKRLREIAE